MQARQYLIIGAVAVLLVLIVVTVLISSLSGKNQFVSQQPTLVPTGLFESTGQNGAGSSLSDAQITKRQQLIQDALGADSSLLSNLPITSSDIELGYSSKLGKFFIDEKTPQASLQLQQFLQAQGLLSLYQQHPEFFEFTNTPVDEAIADAENQTGSDQGGGNGNQNGSGGIGGGNQGGIGGSGGGGNGNDQGGGSGSQDEQNPDLPGFGFDQFSGFLGSLLGGGVNSDDVNKAIDESNNIITQEEGVPTDTPPPGGIGGGGIGGGIGGGGGGGNNDIVFWATKIHENIQLCDGIWSRMTNPPSNGSYKAHYVPGCSYFCTYNVIDSYHLAGYRGPSAPGQNMVYNMRAWWKAATAPFRYLPYTTTQNKVASLKQLHPGCAIMQGQVHGAEHVEVIINVTPLDSHNNGSFRVYSTNSHDNARTYTISNGVLHGTWDSPVDFGCADQ